MTAISEITAIKHFVNKGLKIDSNNFSEIVKKPMNKIIADIFEKSCNKLNYESRKNGLDVLMRAYEDEKGVNLIAKIVDDISPKTEIYKTVINPKERCIGKNFKVLDNFFKQIINGINK